MYQAVINTPGYLPQDDEVYLFDSVDEAWQFLIDQRRREMDLLPQESPTEWDDLEALHTVQLQGQPGTVYLGTPGYQGDHDLKVAYTVVYVNKAQVADPCDHDWVDDRGPRCRLCGVER